MKQIISVIVVVLLVGCVGFLAYQHYSATPIAKVLNSPRDYETSDTQISGVVSDRAALLVAQYFTLKDASGEINVITTRSLPSIGEHLRVRGHAQQTFAIGSMQVVVFVEDQPK